LGNAARATRTRKKKTRQSERGKKLREKPVREYYLIGKVSQKRLIPLLKNLKKSWCIRLSEAKRDRLEGQANRPLGEEHKTEP